MAVPTTASQLLSLVQQSKLVEGSSLEPYAQRLQTDRVANAPGSLASLLVHDGLLTRFQADRLLQGKTRQFHLGRYRVMEPIGSGGMGAVYLCEHTHMRRRVAVKILPAAQARDVVAVQRFQREAEAIAALDHPNIVHAYDVGREGEVYFLVMEYVKGASLQELVTRQGPLDPARAADYLRQASLGLQHAFEAGLIHRDVKPANLLVGESETVKILDLGLARFFRGREDDQLTEKFDAPVMGTADYMSPEQALDSHAVDIRSDIYSLGATFYFCLTGDAPFGGGTIAQKLVAHQVRMPAPVWELRPDVPVYLAAIIEKMMAKDPAARYQAPVDVAHAIASLGAQETTPDLRLVTRMHGKQRPPKRRRLLLAGVAVAILCGLAVFSLLRSGGTPSAAAKVPPSPHATTGVASKPKLDVNFADGFTATHGLKLNGAARWPASRKVLQLTAGSGQASSAFTQDRLPIAQFTAQFDFQLIEAEGDGFAFVIQGTGPTALGEPGGGLGYGTDSRKETGGIARSMAIKFDLFNNEGEGDNSTGLFINGSAPTVGGVPPITGALALPKSSIELRSGRVLTARIHYDGAVLAVTMTDKSTGAREGQTYRIDIPKTVGGPLAHIGFTAGTGRNTATQEILNWVFSSTPPVPGKPSTTSITATRNQS